MAAIHTNPAYWGPDALQFRPNRFITTTSSTDEERLVQPPGANFIPWAAGPRVCPGKKFAQVEFVAVIAKLFMKHRVIARLEAGETNAMAAERLGRILCLFREEGYRSVETKSFVLSKY